MPFEIVRQDITRMRVDAIVNSANPRAVVGGGVDHAIHAAAGPELIAARRAIGDIATGAAAITAGYHLPARYVIHTVGPVWQDGAHGERERLADCYVHSLRLAAEHDCRSVAFPLISAGIFGCPAEIAIAVAVAAIRDFLSNHDMMVYLVVFARQPFHIASGLYTEVQSYIDAHYVAAAIADEYRGDRPAPERRRAALAQEGPADEPVQLAPLEPEELEQLDEDRAPETTHGAGLRTAEKELAASSAAKPPAGLLAAAVPGRAKGAGPQPAELADRLATVDESFSEALLHLIDARGETDAAVYKRANIDRKHFSKIRHDPHYQPSKATALAFAVALHLDLAATRDLIGRAGYALTHSSRADIIVEYFITQHIYDIFTINETLFAFAQPLLGR